MKKFISRSIATSTELMYISESYKSYDDTTMLYLCGYKHEYMRIKRDRDPELWDEYHRKIMMSKAGMTFSSMKVNIS